ncbi:MAG: hypothetical protein PHT40_00075 [Patescibacteria group bacterium]|nr:hypothetical protein [Patescibacteria group bacterium]
MATEIVKIGQARVNELVAEVLQKIIKKGFWTKEEYRHCLEDKDARFLGLLDMISLDLPSSYVGVINASDEEISEAIRAFCAK